MPDPYEEPNLLLINVTQRDWKIIHSVNSTQCIKLFLANNTTYLKNIMLLFYNERKLILFFT